MLHVTDWSTAVHNSLTTEDLLCLTALLWLWYSIVLPTPKSA